MLNLVVRILFNGTVYLVTLQINIKVDPVS